MASIINASTSGVGGVITTADNSGDLNIQSGGSTKIAVTSAGVEVTGTLSATGAVTIPDVAGSFYQTGTWTPTQGAGLSVVGTFRSIGRYTKIGDLVFIEGKLTATTSLAVTAAGHFCGGLPFSASVGTYQPIMMVANQAGTASMNIGGYGTSLYTNGTMAATTNMFFSGTYKLA